MVGRSSRSFISCALILALFLSITGAVAAQQQTLDPKSPQVQQQGQTAASSIKPTTIPSKPNSKPLSEDEDPALIARKLLRVNLSDLAAMGAKPLAYFLARARPIGRDG